MTTNTPAGPGQPLTGPAGAHPVVRRRRPKDIGTAHTTAVIRYLQDNGFPHAELRNQAGAHDKGDVTGTPGVCWEAKGGKAAENASDGQVADWLAETETERVNAHADVGVLVLKRRGVGATNAGRYWAVLALEVSDMLAFGHPPSPPLPPMGPIVPVRLHLAVAVTWLRCAGYGDALAPVDDLAAAIGRHPAGARRAT